MPTGSKSGFVAAFAASLTLVLTARQGFRPIEGVTQITPSTLGRAPLVPPGPLKSPVSIIGAIAVPPFLASIDIMWVDQMRGRLYIADRPIHAAHRGMWRSPGRRGWRDAVPDVQSRDSVPDPTDIPQLRP